jgi:hypothetical protein
MAHPRVLSWITGIDRTYFDDEDEMDNDEAMTAYYD